MRLKVSPKEAIVKIDSLLVKGFLICQDVNVLLTYDEMVKIENWYGEAVDSLKSIFLDFAPVFTFVQPTHADEGNISLETTARDLPSLIRCMEILNSYYKQLVEQVYTPLFYIPDKAQICFFASVCPLEPDSNEDAVCRFLFRQYNYHEWVEMEDIVVGAFGGNKDEYSTKDKAKVDNVYDGVNRKTNEAFGFHVLKKQKTLIALNLPSRFLREERHEMA